LRYTNGRTIAASGALSPLDPSARDEILLERIETRGERPGVAPGAQAHVDPENKAVLGGLAQRGDEPAPQAREELEVALPSAIGLPFFRIKENQIDIGGDVELAAAELSHADHDEVSMPASRDRSARRLCEPRPEIRKRRIDGDFSERGHRAAHFVQPGVPGEIARHRAQQHALAQPPQRRMQRALVPGTLLAQEAPHPFARPARVIRALQLFAQLGPRRDELPGVAGIFERVHEPGYCSGARRHVAATSGAGG